MSNDFGKRISIEEVEEGNTFTPKFDENGLIPVITVEDSTSEILMHGYSNSEALLKSIESMKAHYWSRSRKKLWKKGETSGLTQSIKKILIDDDQDCLIYRVDIGGLGASCHVGYKSCFYRTLDGKDSLTFTETEKVFDPEVIYEGQENPTKL
jgi:phosphoribosyl-AMP cyclohydrolase